MKKIVSQTFVLVMLGSLFLAPWAVGSDYWSRIPREEGDWTRKEAELAPIIEEHYKALEQLANPQASGSTNEPEETDDSVTVHVAENEPTAAKQQEVEAERKQKIKEELEQKQRAEREAQEKEAQERAMAEQRALEAQREQKLKEEQEKLAQERLQAQQLQAEKERAQKQQEELAAAITWQKSSKARGPLLNFFTPEQKPNTPAPSKVPALSAEEEADRAAIELFEEAHYQEELKKAAPFFAAYEQALSPDNTPHIRIVRPKIIQQKELECGYYSAINGALLYNAFRSRKEGALRVILSMLNNPKKIERLLQQAQNKLPGCPKTLEASDIIDILNLYKIQLDSGAYSMYYDQLPDKLTKLDDSNRDIITVLQKLNTQKGFTHIFFLRKAGAHGGQSNLGHWISVVAHNVDNKRIDLYVLDSQYPQGQEATYKNTRFNHDHMWQALAILLHQTNQTYQTMLGLVIQAAQEQLDAPEVVDDVD
ncbi:hypothetical protein JST99_05255 [Candidatus Dependentiae bacterium]|nr:hypothetical protein [Candidatus Dependentiae bacterium]